MTGVSTLGQALEQIQRIKDQQTLFNTLTTQLTTGKKTQFFSGLGNDVLTSQRARSGIESIATFGDNITNANRRIQLMMNSIDSFKKQAQDFLNVLVGFSQQSDHQLGDDVTYDDPLTTTIEDTKVGKTSEEPDVDMATLQRLAKNIYGFMVDLVNTKDGDRYVFGGSETLTQPLTDSGTLDSAVSNLLTQWKAGAITTANLSADLQSSDTSTNPNAVSDTIVGYSSALSAGTAGNVFVRVQQNSEIDYTTLANDPSFRNVLVALSYFKSGDLGPISDVYKPPNTYPGVPDVVGAPGATAQDQKDNFYAVFNNLTSMVSAAVDRADQLSQNLANAQVRVTEIQKSQTDQKNVLLNTVSDVENTDTTELAVKINNLQTQLSASLAVTANVGQLSLVNFLFGN